jgi:hypothetical protein
MRELALWPVATGTLFFPAAAQLCLIQSQLTIVCGGSIAIKVKALATTWAVIMKSRGNTLPWETDIVLWVELGLQTGGSHDLGGHTCVCISLMRRIELVGVKAHSGWAK